MAYWGELKLNRQVLFVTQILEIDIHASTSIDFMRPEWEFEPDYALNRDEESAASIKVNDVMLT